VKYRTEKDSLGPISIPADKLWGPQTQRSLTNFDIGSEIVSLDLINAVAVVK
jgi:fumarate hydratase class II